MMHANKLDLFSAPATMEDNHLRITRTKERPAAYKPSDDRYQSRVYRPLADCAKWLSGGTPSKSNPAYWGGDIPWVSSKSLVNFYVADSEDRVTDAGAANGTRLVPEGSVLFVVRGMSLAKEFRVGITQRPVTFNQDLKALLPADDVDPLYLAFMLKAIEPTVLRMADATSHGTLRVQTDLLEQLPVPLPPLPEQRKIARILGAWDQALADLDALLAAKRRQKKGLAQRLLTGRVRLSGFDSSRVPMRPLSEFLRHFSKRNKTGRNLTPLSCSKVYGIVPQTEIFEKRIASADTSNYKIVRRGDLVYDPMLLWDASIGFVDSVDEGVISPAYATFHLNEAAADRSFFRHLFDGHYMRHQYKVISQGTNTRRRKAMASDFLAVEARIPSLEEQRQIATVLDAADAEIAALETQREALAQQKRGLMQRLLTGEVRVTPAPQDQPFA